MKNYATRILTTTLFIAGIASTGFFLQTDVASAQNRPLSSTFLFANGDIHPASLSMVMRYYGYRNTAMTDPYAIDSNEVHSVARYPSRLNLSPFSGAMMKMQPRESSPPRIVSTGNPTNTAAVVDGKTMLFDHKYPQLVRMRAEFVWEVCNSKYVSYRDAAGCFLRNRRLVTNEDEGIFIDIDKVIEHIR